MKEKIYKICTKLNDGQIAVVEAQEQLLLLFSVSERSEQSKAISDLKDFAYEVCPLHREDDLEEIVGRL
ncbi:hypothetical protein [uncultured phage]|nr:hypothetical protein [uncultured phage]CAD8327834.1 hypothetical protein [uncultured phage]CAD8327839.1 hypothetical protein [uncultured phage]